MMLPQNVREYIEEKQELLEFITTATAKRRDDLEDALNEAKHRRDMVVNDLRSIVNRDAVYGGLAPSWIEEQAKKLASRNQGIEFAEQELDMHDNPDKWREWAEEAFSEPSYFPADYENFTSWG